MGEATSNKVLERKAASGRESHLARAMTVQKAVRLTMAKVAEDQLDLAMAMLSMALGDVETDDLPELVKSEQLLLLLENSRGQIGLAMLDQVLVGGLVQQQTMGQVQAAPEEERQPTRTDAALAGPLLDEFFERLEKVLEQPSDLKTFSGFRFADMAEDSRLALMALEAAEYKSFAVTLDIARGARQGILTFILPAPGPDAPEHEEQLEEEEGAVDPGPIMAKTAMQLQAELKVVLCKFRISLGQLENMQPDSVFELPPNAFPKVDILTINGDVVAKGLIGQLDGQRAVKFENVRPEANHPRRRESDREELDMPEVTGLMDAPIDAVQPSDEFQHAAPMDVTEPASIPEMPDLPDLDVAPVDLPSLDDLPSEAVELPDIEPLPELDDLPNLADMPDLADLPDLKSA